MTTLEETLEPALFNELRLLTASAGPAFLTHLVDDFAHDTETCLAQLRQAVMRGDRAAVGRLAHSIKGMGGQLGGRRLASSCSRLEEKAMTGKALDIRVDLDELESDYRELRRALTLELTSLGRDRIPHVPDLDKTD
jgi:HPt (histidine-containing phosphotransfer) domain-containing protein